MNRLNSVHWSHIESDYLGFLSDLSIMLKGVFFLLVAIALCQCTPVQEKILGTYDLDPDRGCSACEENGPASMKFEDADISDGNPGYYSFEFSDGEEHSGTYVFLQVDTTLALVLYPDSASFQYSQIVGTSLRTDYRITGSRIKEECIGLFKDCTWIRRD